MEEIKILKKKLIYLFLVIFGPSYQWTKERKEKQQLQNISSVWCQSRLTLKNLIDDQREGKIPKDSI